MVAVSCVTLMYAARFEQHDSRECLSGASNRPQGGTGFRMLRAQFWTLMPSTCISKGVQKWTLLGSKVVPPGGSVVGPFILSDVLKLSGCYVPKCQSSLKLL